MTEKTSRKPSPARLRQEARILRAAEKVFAGKGFSGSSMDAVAEAAGLSKQNLIYYFPSKETLYHRVLQDILDLWMEKMAFIEDPQAEPAELITAYIRGKLELSRDYPDASRVFAHEVINGAPVLKNYLLSHLKPLFERDSARVRQWIADGKIDPIEPEHLFFCIWASTQTYADFASQIQLLLGKTKLEQEDFDKAASLLTRMVLNGIGAK
ncbi:TetR family transcriptional regulator C-terminal domain-containing protein [Marinobacterium arenosum]|uniref:TetR family transcriptional regulator C-terminal domain-containing protein n=1 Tax=Marinobacterium arenosum TaxID=2862496 RepID=UPI001C9671FD|nr:TetR family transcriptional regulator C-terminal domain-containing protein [Marinobacterium arenosum]MBY4677016.1 TetR family transcriptional regulator C-terminal domain-containing protein [Marinobacterium arenosum]